MARGGRGRGGPGGHRRGRPSTPLKGTDIPGTDIPGTDIPGTGVPGAGVPDTRLPATGRRGTVRGPGAPRSPEPWPGPGAARVTPPSAVEREDRVHAGLFLRPAGAIRRGHRWAAWRTHLLPAGQRQRPGDERCLGEVPGEPARRTSR